MKLLITGSTGFVGRAASSYFKHKPEFDVTLCSRSGEAILNSVPSVAIGDIGPDNDWSNLVRGQDAVIHLAGLTPKTDTPELRVDSASYHVNTLGTLNLARQAALARVRRFVFVSSIKVNGEGTPDELPYRSDTPPVPKGVYGWSKLLAETGLREIAARTGLEVVVLRPTMVYGSGARGNFAALVAAVRSGIPLPLGAVQNQRSLISIGNLVSCLHHCLIRRNPGDIPFLLAEGPAVSTPQLIRELALALDRPARLVAVSPVLLESAALMMGKRGVARRLLGSLTIDYKQMEQDLGWRAPYSFADSIASAVRSSPAG